MDLYSVLSMLVLIAVVLALFTVRKPREYRYSTLDISGIILNAVLGILIYPPLSVAGMLLGIGEFATEPLGKLLEQAAIAMGNLMPAVSMAGIGASVVLRRRERPGWSFLVQFSGIAFFALTMLAAKASGSY